jgi:hypothetical protein
LGEIALADEDLPLARAHFGYAYEMGNQAIPEAGLRGPLVHTRPANEAFFEAGRGLVWCLKEAGEAAAAEAIARRLKELDPTAPISGEDPPE